MKKTLKVILLTTIFGVMGLPVAMADQAGEHNDEVTQNGSYVSLIQAVTSAEQHASGIATQAELKRVKNKVVYNIEVSSQSKTFDVLVDARTGTVVKSSLDKKDRGYTDDNEEQQANNQIVDQKDNQQEEND